jgi:hypothetical protein
LKRALGLLLDPEPADCGDGRNQEGNPQTDLEEEHDEAHNRKDRCQTTVEEDG